MGAIEKVTKAATVAGGIAALVTVTRSAEHNEVETVTLAGVPLFSRDLDGNPRIFGIPFRRRRAPRT